MSDCKLGRVESAHLVAGLRGSCDFGSLADGFICGWIPGEGVFLRRSPIARVF
jgi:hypothetical protein